MNHGKVAYTQGNQVIVATLNTGETQVIDMGGLIVRSMNWNPDGERIAVAVQQVAVLTPATSDQASATIDETQSATDDFAVLPEQIAVIFTGTPDILPLVEGDADVSFPAWHPDGIHLLYTVKSDGLYAFNTVSGEVNRLDLPFVAIQPAWNKSGDRLSFVAVLNGNKHVMVGKWTDGSLYDTRQITQTGKFNHNPAWSVDSKWIAHDLFNEQTNRWSIGLIEVDAVTLDVRQSEVLDRTGFDQLSPQWGPETDTLLFVRRAQDGTSDIIMSRLSTGDEVLVSRQGGQSPAWWYP